MQPLLGQSCECDGCQLCHRQEEDGRCLSLHGQKYLFDGSVIELYHFEARFYCNSCLPKPIVEPANLDFKLFNREMERLEKQETLFFFR